MSANAGKIAGQHVVVDAKKGLDVATLASGIRSTVGVSGQYEEPDLPFCDAGAEISGVCMFSNNPQNQAHCKTLVEIEALIGPF